MKVFNIGDRVLYEQQSKFRCIKQTSVVLRFSPRDRVYIELLGVLNTQGTNIQKWISSNEIKKDLQYYRELKINELLYVT